MPLSDALPEPSIAPVCPYFYQCGGCDSQDVPYSEQVLWKQASLERLFDGLASDWLPFLASPEEYPVFFRNKIRFSFVTHEGKLWPSRHRKGDEDGDIPVTHCYLQSPESNQYITFIAEYATEAGWEPYDPGTGKGWLKHVLIRQGKRTGETLISLVTGEGEIPSAERWIDAMRSGFPNLTSLYQTVTHHRDVMNYHDIHLWGGTHIHENIGESVFRIAPHAFFQTNSEMVEALYDTVKRQVAASRPKTVWDLYAGSATIGIHICKEAENIVCIESNKDNVDDALWNIETNGAANVTVLDGQVEQRINGQLIATFGKPELVIVDPPRAGLSEQTRTILSGVRPATLVYISCNPATCLRDCRDLVKRGFTITSLQGVDMFPHTVHCEMVVTLSHRQNNGL